MNSLYILSLVTLDAINYCEDTFAKSCTCDCDSDTTYAGVCEHDVFHWDAEADLEALSDLVAPTSTRPQWEIGEQLAADEKLEFDQWFEYEVSHRAEAPGCTRESVIAHLHEFGAWELYGEYVRGDAAEVSA